MEKLKTKRQVEQRSHEFARFDVAFLKRCLFSRARKTFMNTIEDPPWMPLDAGGNNRQESTTYCFPNVIQSRLLFAIGGSFPHYLKMDAPPANLYPALFPFVIERRAENGRPLSLDSGGSSFPLREMEVKDITVMICEWNAEVILLLYYSVDASANSGAPTPTPLHCQIISSICHNYIIWNHVLQVFIATAIASVPCIVNRERRFGGIMVRIPTYIHSCS
jgi:hypothetical protein